MSMKSPSQRTTKIYPVSQARRIVINRQPVESAITITRSTTSKAGNASAAGFERSADPEMAQMRNEVGAKIQIRSQQKEIFGELNERLADYIEKVRFLDAQNRRLRKEVETLRDRSNRETYQVNVRYDCEIENLKRLIEASEKEKLQSEQEVIKVQEEFNNFQDQLSDLYAENARNQQIKDSLNKQLVDYEAEIAVLRRQSTAFDCIKERNKREILRLKNEELRIKKDLDNEIMSGAKAEMEAIFLRDLIESTEQAHLVRWQDLASRIYADSTEENREVWSSEFKKQFKNMQQAFEQKVNDVSDEVTEKIVINTRQMQHAAPKKMQMESLIVKQEMSTLGNRVLQLQSQIDAINSAISQQETEAKSLEELIAVTRKSNGEEISAINRSLTDVKANYESAKIELQKFFDLKLSTEIELANYKKLLDSEVVTETVNIFDSHSYQKATGRIEVPEYFSSTKRTFIKMQQ